MKTNTSSPPMWVRVAVGAFALLILVTIGTALAAAPSTTAYHFSSHPMISGTVVTVNDHQMIVNTDQGEQVTLEIDTRTMAPRDLAPGMVMRAEFLALEDCRFYAQRIMPIRGGMSTNRLQAYANTSDSRETILRNASASGNYRESSDRLVLADNRVSEPQTIGEHSSGAVTKAVHSTADYLVSTRPMLSGRVVSVNDHLLVIETDQGQPVGLVMDSHTMVPREVAPGTLVRADFTQMKDGRYYAKWITPKPSGDVDREQAYAHTRDSDAVIASNVSDCGCVSTTTRNSATSSVERRETVVTPVAVVESAPVVQETLPQTASKQPLILLLGLFALGSAGLVTVVRSARIV